MDITKELIEAIRESLQNGKLLNYDFEKEEVFEYFDVDSTLSEIIFILKKM